MWRAFRALRRAGEITWYFVGGLYTISPPSGTLEIGAVYTVTTSGTYA